MVPDPDSDLVRFIFRHVTEQHLLLTHVSDHTGHCAGCNWIEKAAPVHPCDLYLAAARVAQLRAAGEEPVQPEPAR